MEGKSPISKLQEFCTSEHYPAPRYEYESAKADKIMFTCICSCNNFVTSALSSRKKDAKTFAAKEMLVKLTESMVKTEQIPDLIPVPIHVPVVVKIEKDSVSCLNLYCAKNALPYPVYTSTDKLEAGKFMSECTHLTFTTSGIGYNKKVSKQIAAAKMMERLEIDNKDLISFSDDLDTVTNKELIEMYEKHVNDNKNEVNKRKEKNEITTLFTSVIPSKKLNEQFYEDDLVTLEEKFQKLNIEYKIEELHGAPFILTFQRIDHSESENTFVQMGDTYIEAKTRLLRKVLKIYEEL